MRNFSQLGPAYFFFERAILPFYNIHQVLVIGYHIHMVNGQHIAIVA